jgi:hypothetical protein
MENDKSLETPPVAVADEEVKVDSTKVIAELQAKIDKLELEHKKKQLLDSGCNADAVDFLITKYKDEKFDIAKITINNQSMFIPKEVVKKEEKVKSWRQLKYEAYVNAKKQGK